MRGRGLLPWIVPPPVWGTHTMKSWFFGIAVMAFALLGTGCGGGDKKKGAGSGNMAAPFPSSNESGHDLEKAKEHLSQDNQGGVKKGPGQARERQDALNKQAQPADRKIIYTATLKLEVEDFPRAKEAL